MQKDLKIGMIIGVVLLIVATLVISFLSEGSLESRLEGKFNNPSTSKALGEDFEEPALSSESNTGDKTELPPPPDTPTENTAKIHIVADGENLNDIADKYFGNALMINKIIDENPQIPDSYKLTAGMKLKIPE